MLTGRDEATLKYARTRKFAGLDDNELSYVAGKAHLPQADHATKTINAHLAKLPLANQ